MVTAFFATRDMTAVFSSEGTVGRMLAFEAALARAEAASGVIPEAAARAIAAACRVELFDAATLYAEAAIAGTLAIPLSRRLTELVEREAGQYVHWGATSQDAIDTTLVLQMRDGLDLLLSGLLEIATRCASLAETHRHTLMPGRTLLQHATPITFGLKAARWLSLITRLLQRLRELRRQVSVIQFGGAAGTLAALSDRGPSVAEALARELDLDVPDLPWHAERDRIAEVAAALGIVAGAAAKIAGDLVLLSQTEIGEISEGAAPGKGGSSAMPQKQNPIDATLALASARLAIGLVPVLLGGMAQEHERAAGGWQAEWPAVPDLFCHVAGAIERVRRALAGLVVHTGRMRENIDLTHGLIMAESLTMALAARIGRPAAFQLVQTLCAQVSTTGHLRQAAMQNGQVTGALSAEDIDRALDPAHYLGSTGIFIDRALAGFRATAAGHSAAVRARSR